jgi:hypothetical protein
VTIDVEDRNVENLEAILDAPVKWTGRVTWDGEAPGERMTKNSLTLRRVDEIPSLEARSTAFTPDAKTGDFVVEVQPGTYALQLSASLVSSNAYIGDVKQGETSVLDTGIKISAGSQESITVELRSRGGTVLGTAIDPSRLRPLAHAAVALVPELSRRGNSGLYWGGKSASDGTFKFTGIPPGNYKVFGWASVPVGAWENAAFLQRYEDRGIAVTVEAGSEKNVQITVIR